MKSRVSKIWFAIFLMLVLSVDAIADDESIYAGEGIGLFDIVNSTAYGDFDGDGWC